VKKAFKPAWLVAASLAALAAVNFVYPFVWVLTPVYGQVLNRATGTPIANAAVAVSWSLQSWEGSVVGYLYLGETTTDERGDFRISVWGPRFHFSQGRVQRTQPEIRVIADDYLPVEARSSNDVTGAFFYAGAKQNGQVFRLDAAVPGERYERAVQAFVNYFLFTSANRHCDWLRIPQTFERVGHARESLAAMGMGLGLPSGAPPPGNDCT
jgi:hypothetical protein